MIALAVTRATGRPGVRSTAPARALRVGTATIVMALSLAACQHTQYGSVPEDGYRTRHPIVLKEVPQTLDVPVGLTTSRLTEAQEGQIAGFAREAGERGDGIVDILVPSGSANESAANYLAGKIGHIVNRAGVPRHSVNLRAYTVPDPRAVAPIRLSYAAIRADVHQCGIWPDNIANGPVSHADYWEFGCASQSNLAAMVANPSDLIHPRASTPADQTRRGVVIDKYRLGEPTASQTEERDATVSDVGGS